MLRSNTRLRLPAEIVPELNIAAPLARVCLLLQDLVCVYYWSIMCVFITGVYLLQSCSRGVFITARPKHRGRLFLGSLMRPPPSCQKVFIYIFLKKITLVSAGADARLHCLFRARTRGRGRVASATAAAADAERAHRASSSMLAACRAIPLSSFLP
jgi:hypothetical protein